MNGISLGRKTGLTASVFAGVFGVLFGMSHVANAQAIINTSGGTNASDGLRVSVNRSTQVQIDRLGTSQLYQDAGQGAFEPGASKVGSGIFMTVGAGAAATTIGPAITDYVRPISADWTFISRTGGSAVGSGTITTKHSAIVAGRTYGLTATYSYNFPDTFITLKIDLVVPAGNALPVRLYLPTDGNLGGLDTGFHRYLAIKTPLLQVYDPDSGIAMGWRYSSGPPWSGYLGGYNRCQWEETAAASAACANKDANLQKGIDWPNYVDPARVDSGVGIMWNFGAGAGTYTVASDFVFTSYCTANAQCPGAAPVCNTTTNLCGQCHLDADCSATNFCNTELNACTPKLATGIKVPTIDGHAPPLTGACTNPAVGAAVCTAAVCSVTNNLCGLAVGEGPCTVLNGPTICQSGKCSAITNKCIAGGGCVKDADCNQDTEWCNIGAATCTPRIPNSNPLPTDSGHTSPALNGACTPAAAAVVCITNACDTHDDKCGLANATPCSGTASQCRSNICFTDAKCGKPDGVPCASAPECRSGVCAADGACGTPNGASCTDPSLCRSGICENNICSSGIAVHNTAVVDGSLEGGGIGCSSTGSTSNTSSSVVMLMGVAIAIGALRKRQR